MRRGGANRCKKTGMTQMYKQIYKKGAWNECEENGYGGGGSFKTIEKKHRDIRIKTLNQTHPACLKAWWRMYIYIYIYLYTYADST